MYAKCFASSCPMGAARSRGMVFPMETAPTHPCPSRPASVLTAKFNLHPLYRNVVRLAPPWSKRLELTHHKQACLVSDILSQTRAQWWPTCHRAIPHRLSHPPPQQQSSIRPVACAIDTHVRSDLKLLLQQESIKSGSPRENQDVVCYVASSWLFEDLID